MVGQALRLGPFTGGLNLASDPTAIGDSELTECENFELDIDGSLLSRTPFVEMQGDGRWSERIILLGEAVFSGNHYLLGSNSSGVYHYLNGTWTLITNTFRAAAAVQYANKVYFVAHPTSGTGGKWDPVGGFTAVAAIPKGQAAVIHKERLFIAPGAESTSNESTLKFSNAGDFETWGASDFINIGDGDGTKLIDLTVFQDNLLLFKSRSTYALPYDIRPADAVVRKVSNTIGASRQFNVVNYENQVYVISGNAVYEIINYDFNRLNTKVPFERTQTLPAGFTFANEPVFLGLLGDRLVCRFYGHIYIYGLRTRQWTTWTSTQDQLQYFGPISVIHTDNGDEYYAGSALLQSQAVIRLFDTHTSTDIERSYSTFTNVAVDTFNRTTVANGWGVSTGGQTWQIAGGATSDFATNIAEGTHTLTSVGVTRISYMATGTLNPDFTVSVKTAVLAAGGSQVIDLVARQTGNTTYFVRVEFSTSANVLISLFKTIAGVNTTLVSSVTTGITHLANTYYKIRLRLVETRLSGKVWLASNSEPTAFQVSVLDTSITAGGDIGVRSTRNTGNTNTNLLVTYDDFVANAVTTVTPNIVSYVRSKNFDMAISHQFKRLWWWGADVATANTITGTASPIVTSFQVYWGGLISNYWGELLDNYWGQPLITPQVVDTVVPTITQPGRQFVKFNKGLRYRQINFKVQLLTQGSLQDGPARLFTMTIHTESKQIVPKSVN